MQSFRPQNSVLHAQPPEKQVLSQKFIGKAVDGNLEYIFLYKSESELNGGLVLRQAHKSHLVLTIAETTLFSTKTFPGIN